MVPPPPPETSPSGFCEREQELREPEEPSGWATFWVSNPPAPAIFCRLLAYTAFRVHNSACVIGFLCFSLSNAFDVVFIETATLFLIPLTFN